MTEPETSDSWQKMANDSTSEWAKGVGAAAGAMTGLAAVCDRLAAEVLDLQRRLRQLEGKADDAKR